MEGERGRRDARENNNTIRSDGFSKGGRGGRMRGREGEGGKGRERKGGKSNESQSERKKLFLIHFLSFK